MTGRGRLPYDSEHLTPVESEVERNREARDCWHCEFLKCHRRSGFRGCEHGHEVYPVMSGQIRCEDWKAK